MARLCVAFAVSALSLLGLDPRARIGVAHADDDPDTFSAHPAAATAKSDDDKSSVDHLVPKAAGGFLLLNGTLSSVPSAVARNQTDYGLVASIGVSASGTPWEKWEYLAYVTSGIATDAVTGTGGSVAPEQITVTVHPIKEVSIQAGYMRIPFSLGQATVITSSMFPTRPEPTALFQSGADAGILAGYESHEGRLKAKAGLFDGLSLNLTVPNHTTRGPVLSAWTEVAPLGGMTPLEGDFNGSPLRFAVSGGLVYRKGIAYDAQGYQGLGVNDIRFSIAARLAFKGLYVQGEYLQDLRTDDLSERPRLARGTYGEASYHFLVKKLGLAPVTRLGWSVQDEGFYPLHVVTGDVGLALYPRGDLANRGGVRVLVEYQSERHIEDRETAYGGVASVMARF